MGLMSFDNLNEIRIKVDTSNSRVCLFIYIFDKENIAETRLATVMGSRRPVV